jgi:hypothetical protein
MENTSMLTGAKNPMHPKKSTITLKKVKKSKPIWDND